MHSDLTEIEENLKFEEKNLEITQAISAIFHEPQMIVSIDFRMQSKFTISSEQFLRYCYIFKLAHY